MLGAEEFGAGRLRGERGGLTCLRLRGRLEILRPGVLRQMGASRLQARAQRFGSRLRPRLALPAHDLTDILAPPAAQGYRPARQRPASQAGERLRRRGRSEGIHGHAASPDDP
jgi:hypothetical protein